MHEVSQELRKIAGCLSPIERDFIYNYVKNNYTGRGEIVDLGCFLGSSTYAQAMGLQSNTIVRSHHTAHRIIPYDFMKKILNQLGMIPIVHDKNKRIHAFDLFQWETWMEREVARYGLARTFSVGQSFQQEFANQMGDLHKFIETTKADLLHEKWESQKPIEYLFIDAMKSWNLCSAIIRNFYRYLVPGLSVVHHQDFALAGPHWIHLTMFRLKNYFKPIEHGDLIGSQLFEFMKKIPDDLLNQEYSMDMFSLEEINEAFEYGCSVVAPTAKDYVLSSKVTALIEKDELDLACEVSVQLEEEHRSIIASHRPGLWHMMNETNAQ